MCKPSPFHSSIVGIYGNLPRRIDLPRPFQPLSCKSSERRLPVLSLVASLESTGTESLVPTYSFSESEGVLWPRCLFKKIDEESTSARNYETNIRHGMLQNVWMTSKQTADVYLQLSESGVVL